MRPPFSTASRFCHSSASSNIALANARVSVGLSYVSLADRTARITLAGESMNVVLQEAQKIKLSDRSCDLTMTNIISDTEAAFLVNCGGT